LSVPSVDSTADITPLKSPLGKGGTIPGHGVDR
jgi:hypothetical protein